MFTTLIDWLERLWEAVLAVFQTVWDWTKYGYVWLVGLVLAFVTVTQQVVVTVGQFVSDLATTLGSLTLSTSPGSTGAFSDWLAVGNTIFPVQEGFTLMAALSVTWLACIVYRFIKSWIPTVN
jgi:hypothetical protein